MILKIKQSKSVDDVLVCAVTEEELDSDLEAEQNGKLIPLDLETQTTDLSQQIDSSEIGETSDSIDDLDLLASLQKMRAKEQALIEQKQRLVATEQNLHNKLIQEIEKKKATIANLITEITELQNMTKQLGEALGIDLYNKTQALTINPPKLIEPKVQQALQCDGLLNCAKPEKCRNYDSCLKKYLTAEMRNEDLRL